MAGKSQVRWLVALVIVGVGFGCLYTAMAAKRCTEDQAVYEHAKALSKTFRQVADVATPAVVKIQTKANVKQVKTLRKGENPFKGSPFEHFFKNLPEDFDYRGGMPRAGVGSGVIIEKSGLILTYNHVVDGADDVV